jgi:hypothetical protein
MPNSIRTCSKALRQAVLQQALQHVARVAGPDGVRLQQHGVLELLDASDLALPAALVPTARQARCELLARELLHAQVLDILHAALIAARVSAVLIKGEALARLWYPYPAVRPRHDIDVWIAPADRPVVEQLLRQFGAQPQVAAWGRWIQPEQLWRWPLGKAAVGIDLHWQFCSRPVLLGALPLAQVLQQSTAYDAAVATDYGLRLPALDDALLLACIHRRAHHRDAERWIWLLDIVLLWEQLHEAQRAALVDKAIAGAVAALLGDALRRVAQLLPTPADSQLLIKLERAAAIEPARLLLLAPAAYSDLRFDLRYASGRRLAVLRDYLLPRAGYMRARYAGVRPRWLPWLYLRRLLRLSP